MTDFNKFITEVTAITNEFDFITFYRTYFMILDKYCEKYELDTVQISGLIHDSIVKALEKYDIENEE